MFWYAIALAGIWCLYYLQYEIGRIADVMEKSREGD